LIQGPRGAKNITHLRCRLEGEEIEFVNFLGERSVVVVAVKETFKKS
jgi:hypothetical protein